MKPVTRLRRPGGPATLVLFDVDGTLLHSSSAAHTKAFAEAARVLWGAPDPFSVEGGMVFCAGVCIHGLVDAQIARRCCAAAGQDPAGSGVLEAFRVESVAAYEALLGAGADPGVVGAGVVELLERLEEAGCALGLLTGNTEEICAAKMAAVGLDDRFCCGGFGGVTAQRSALFPEAFAAAEAAGITTESCVYVGDTPRDVAAARAAGVAVVAVATGQFPPEVLGGADAVLDSFVPARHAAEVLMGVAQHHPRRLR